MLVINNIKMLINVSNDYIKVTEVLVNGGYYSIVSYTVEDAKNFLEIRIYRELKPENVYEVNIITFKGLKKDKILRIHTDLNNLSTPYKFLNWITGVIDKLSEYADNKKL
jgi:NAD-dependent SIR2 family protein deacetylase